jgi:hypothetical protein
MQYLDELRERRKSKTAVQQKIRMYKSRNVDFIAFFEGQDDQSFFLHFLEQELQDKDIYPIICDGKGGVLGARDFAENEYKILSGMLFFIDKDHDDFIGNIEEDAHTFITKYYSIESYFFEPSILHKFIKQHYGLSNIDPITKIVESTYFKIQAQVIHRLRSIMAHAVILRRRGVNPNLENVKFSKIFRIENGVFIKQNLFRSELEQLFCCEITISKISVRNFLKDTSDLDCRFFVRGKLLAEFFCAFFNKLDSILNHTKDISGSELSTSIQLGRRNFVNLLMHLIPMPTDFCEFLDNFRVKV